MKKTIVLILPALLLLVSCAPKKEAGRPPNIVIILADDLGFGDLSCFGQERFSTPNIDRLAAEGMRLTRHYAGSTVCAPSRSALMTGQHTGHTPIRGNRGIPPEGQWPLPDESLTLAEMLKQKGYVCGAFGKWGLGGPGSEGDPLNQGFDVFFGYNCQTLAHNYYPLHLWDNSEKLILPGNEGNGRGTYAPFLIHEKALSFIENNRERPFFLYYPSIIPHAELIAPQDRMARYRDSFPPEKPYLGAEPGDPRYKAGAYGSQAEPHAAFAAMIGILDEQVGELLQKIVDLGLAENTLVIFSSDNGPHLEGGADPDYFNSNGAFRGYKRDLYEGGIRVPAIAWWPGKIKAGTESDHLSAFWDLYPTLAELTGQEVHDSVDGLSCLPVLTGDTSTREHEYLYWEFHEMNGKQALLKGDWKLVRLDVLVPGGMRTELYHLADDPGETKDIYGKYPEKLNELETLLTRCRWESPDFPFLRGPTENTPAP